MRPIPGRPSSAAPPAVAIWNTSPTESHSRGSRLSPRDTRAEAEIAQRIVRDGGATIGESADVVAADPDGVRRAEAGPEEAERVEMRGQALPVARGTGHRLHAR